MTTARRASAGLVHAARLEGVCADTIAQARTAAGKDYVMLMADMFGEGYGEKPKRRGAAGRPDRRAPGPRLPPCLGGAA